MSSLSLKRPQVLLASMTKPFCIFLNVGGAEILTEIMPLPYWPKGQFDV
jgi:hypothetical protein